MTETPPPPQPTSPQPSSTSKRFPLIFALVVIVLGAWLLLESMGVNVPRISKIWPIFLAVGGVASLLDFLTLSRKPRSAGQAVFGLGAAAVGFVFSSGAAGWEDVLDWLPALPIIMGLAMLTTWAAAGRRDTGLFAASLVVLGIGVLGIFARFQFLRDLLPSAQLVWAVALLLVGIVVTWRVFSKNE